MKTTIICWGAMLSISFSAPKVVSLIDEGDAFTASFTSEFGKTYALWGAESLNSTWWHIRNVKPGEGWTTLSLSPRGEILTTVSLSKPFVHWSGANKGFFRVSEVVEPQMTKTQVPIENMWRDGEGHLNITFPTTPWMTYVVWGSSDMSNWCPVDVIIDGEVQSPLVIEAVSDSTTLKLNNPILPWATDDEFIMVTTEPREAAPAPRPGGPMAAMAIAQPRRWFLVCTKDGKGDQGMLSKGTLTTMVLVNSTSGASCGWAGKYSVMTAYAKCTIDGVMAPRTVAELPLQEQEQEETKVIKQFIMLDRYFGDETPTVRYIPNPKVDAINGHLQLHLRIEDSVSIATAVWKSPRVLKDSIGLKPFGVGFDINLPPSEMDGSLQKRWAFSAMDQSSLEAFRDSVCPDYKPAPWDQSINPEQ